MPETYKYSVFGLTVESELELPELNPTDAAADVSVVFGKTPEHLETPEASTPWMDVKAGQFLLTVDAAGRYYAENGNRIVIEPFPGADGDDLRTFLYDSVFAALLQQRGLLALHGAAVVMDGKAVVLLGHSSAGKSTLAHALCGRGHAILTDEICAVGLLNGRAAVYPGVPRLALWEDALKRAKIDFEGLRPVRRGLHKYSFPVGEQFAAGPVALSRLFLLHDCNQNPMLCEHLNGADKLEKLMQQQFFLQTAPDRTKHFRLSALTASADIASISYVSTPNSEDKVADIIQKEMGV